MPEKRIFGVTNRSAGQNLARWVLGLILVTSLMAIVLISAEIALLLLERNDRRCLDKFLESNIFLNRSAEFAYEGSLWKKQWHSYRPNAEFSRRVGDIYYEVRINRWGFRTHDFEEHKPPTVFRVVCIGGSTTVQGRTNEATYPAFLQEMLRESHPDRKIEVLNLGISGTTSNYWLQRQEYLFTLKPNMIIQYNVVNDILNVHLDNWAEQHPWRAFIYRNSRLAQRWLPFDSDQFAERMHVTLSNFGELRSAAIERGVEYVLGTFAIPDYSNAENNFQTYLDFIAEDWSGGYLNYRAFNEIIAYFNQLLCEWAENLGQEVVPVARAIRSPLLFADICHLRQKGIRLKAETFLPAVSKAIIRDKE